jgi:hypothetical protein
MSVPAFDFKSMNAHFKILLGRFATPKSVSKFSEENRQKTVFFTVLGFAFKSYNKRLNMEA